MQICHELYDIKEMRFFSAGLGTQRHFYSFRVCCGVDGYCEKIRP